MKNFDYKNIIAPTLSLFLSSGTLICCALPALFITLGLGATLAGLTSTFPQMIWLSEHKNILFPSAGLMLVLAGYMQWQARFMPCPVDPIQAKSCMRLRRISLWIYIVSVIIFLTGTFFTFVAPYIFF
jgi:hypothetical protein